MRAMQIVGKTTYDMVYIIFFSS